MVRIAFAIDLVMPIISNVYLMKLSDNKFWCAYDVSNSGWITFQMMLSFFVVSMPFTRMDHPDRLGWHTSKSPSQTLKIQTILCSLPEKTKRRENKYKIHPVVLEITKCHCTLVIATQFELQNFSTIRITGTSWSAYWLLHPNYTDRVASMRSLMYAQNIKHKIHCSWAFRKIRETIWGLCIVNNILLV